MFQICRKIIIALIFQTYAQFVKHIKLCKMREYRKKLARFELTRLMQNEIQALKTDLHKKVPFAKYGQVI